MFASSSHNPVSVALATVAELPRSAQDSPDAERAASRIAAGRAIRAIAGYRGRIEIRRRAHRAPVAQVVAGDASRRHIALSLTHRNGHAAAIAAPAGSLIGIDLESPRGGRPVARAVLPHRSGAPVRGQHRGRGSLVDQGSGLEGAAARTGRRVSRAGARHRRLRHSRRSLSRHALARRRRDLPSPWPGYLLATAQLGGGR